MGLGSGTCPCLLYLHGYEAVYLGIELGVLALLLRDNGLYGALLLLQVVHHLLLLFLFLSEFLLGSLSLAEQLAFVALHVLELRVLVIQLALLDFYLLALCTLIRGILAHKTHAAVSLRQALGAEDEHEAVLNGPVLGHIAHRLHILLLALIELLLQVAEL